MSAWGSGSAVRPLDWIGSPVVLCSAGVVSAGSVKSAMR